MKEIDEILSKYLRVTGMKIEVTNETNNARLDITYDVKKLKQAIQSQIVAKQIEVLGNLKDNIYMEMDCLLGDEFNIPSSVLDKEIDILDKHLTQKIKQLKGE